MSSKSVCVFAHPQAVLSMAARWFVVLVSLYGWKVSWFSLQVEMSSNNRVCARSLGGLFQFSWLTCRFHHGCKAIRCAWFIQDGLLNSDKFTFFSTSVVLEIWISWVVILIKCVLHISWCKQISLSSGLQPRMPSTLDFSFQSRWAQAHQYVRPWLSWGELWLKQAMTQNPHESSQRNPHENP